MHALIDVFGGVMTRRAPRMPDVPAPKNTALPDFRARLLSICAATATQKRQAQTNRWN
jgi:hypothetical protein